MIANLIANLIVRQTRHSISRRQQNRLGVLPREDTATPALKQRLHRAAHLRVVVDDGNAQAMHVAKCGHGRFGRWRLKRGRQHQAKARAAAWQGAELQRQLQHAGQTPHDREPEAQTARAVTVRIADLIELLEHPLLFGRRDANAGIPHLDEPMPWCRGCIAAAPAAAQQHAAAARVFHRVAEQIAHDALDQQRIARRTQPLQRGRQAQPQPQALVARQGL